MGRLGARRLVLLAACLGLCWARGALGASFYGESYVELNVIEFSSELSLRLKFQTSKPQGLLFLAAGENDYCIIELLSGNLWVRANLGAGEQVLLSEQRLHVDDLTWHLVELYCVKDTVSLVVDKHYETTGQVTGGMHNLHFRHGVYVGGHNGLDVPYLVGELPNFRGCMEDVVFNQREILTSLRSYPGFKKVYEVSLGCSDEFFAGEGEAINFFSSRSYITFPQWKMQGEGLLEFALQTGTQQALILFQSGREGEFVALEIVKGVLRAHVGRSKSTTRLSSFRLVSDDKWHVIQLRFTERHLDLMVDEQGVRASLPLKGKPFVSEGPLFVGGLDNRKREEVKKLELASVPRKSTRRISFKGCLKGLEANSEKRALKDALVSKDISVGCKMKSRDAENLSITTTENVLRSEVLPSPAIPEAGKLFLQDASSSFLVLNDLEVQEGGQALLEQRHVKVGMKFKDLGIHHSQILFKIKEMPIHGFLRLAVSPEQETGKAFTLLDLEQGKVRYVHDGSEETRDYFTFSVSSNSKEEMPLYLQGHVPYVFNIIVIPVNDPPYLKLPEGNLLLLFEKSKKQLTPDIIHVSDPDTDSLSLSLSVLGNFDSDAGFLENTNDPGRAVNGFTLGDLKDGNIFYVHRGHQNSRILLRASDGELVSNTVVLRVMAVPWDFEVANRTGVVVRQGDTVLITQSNLSVEVNGEHHEMETHYIITRLPQFGQIQRQESSGEWKQVSTFSQHSIDRGQIRYCSTFKELQLENVTDHFKFKVNIEGKISGELMFPVTVQWLKFTLLKIVPLEIDKRNRQVLNCDHLQAVTEGVEVAEEELHFKLQTPPKKGKLLLGNKVLKTNSIFSQHDITDSKVSYEPQERPREDTQDTFTFSIVAKHIESKDYTFTINLKPAKTHIILTNRGLFVKEGGEKLITKSELFAQTLDNQTFQYKLMRSPQHGKLKLVNFSHSLGSHDNVTTFTNEDIVGERLMYVHDDSETQWDEFLLVASTTSQEGVVRGLDTEHLSTELKVIISIGPKNDERPVRVVDKVFHVVRNGQRLLTLADLCYHDPDSDFDDGQLLYTRRGIPNGDLVRTSDPTQKLYQFRQDDLQAGRVLFRHRGADSARFVLFVTDGVHYTSSLLEVSVSDPYIQLANNTGLLVMRGEDSRLTAANLSVTTNQDIRTNREIEFRIVQPAKHGRVLVNSSVSHTFTQHDLMQGHVVYRHDGSGNFDVFNLTVKVKETYLAVSVYVQVSLESHQQPTQVLHSKTLVVEEGKPVKLGRGKLQAVREDDIPSEATFIVRTPPMHGYLRKSLPEESSLGANEKSPLIFTQQDIDDGNIYYVQTAPDQQKDHFLLDVMNGFQAVSGVEILVDIVPKRIPLEVQNFTVQEGGSRALLEDDLKIPSKYFEGLDCEFVLLKPPKHGYVENSHFPRVKLMKFTRKQVENELIYYVHDDSEELLDNFTIFANSLELGKQSFPQTLFVTVESINDEAPVITANKILQVWVNSVTEITSSDLCAEDRDSSPQDLAYWVTPPSNGHLALKSFPGQSIQNFTQVQINNGQLVFVHTGAMSGGFNFQVTDGLNSAPPQIFTITARALIISLEVNRGLSIFPGSTKPLSSRDLRAVTNDEDSTGNRTITFMVVSSPRLGKLMRVNPDNSTEDVSVFTQDLVNEQLILYQHVDHENTGWTAEDSFMFTVSSPPAALGPEKFRITISCEINEPGRQSCLLANTGAAVKEGDKFLIDQSKLDASNFLLKLPESQRSSYEIWFQVTSLPHHGTIMVGERNITKGKPYFSQYMINKFGITYVHDDSESLADNFTFAVWPNPKSKSVAKPEADFLEETFNITISPINDHAPELKTKGLRLKVLQGDSLVVGPDNLKVEDLDNPPEEIRYTIIRSPNNGFLSMAHHLNTPVHHFTQANIDNSQVWFTQDGSPSSGAFYFSVTDGQHRPLYKLFHVDVIPISITVVNLTDLLLPQGQTTISITNAHLSAMTNGRSPQITYKITCPLQHGHLLIENQMVISFRQEDLESGRLSYHMTNLTASEDQLQFSVFTSENNLTGLSLSIKVQPLLQVLSNLTVTNRVAYQLTRKDLDASELANRTNSDPKFEVTEPPVYGRLVRRVGHGTLTEDATLFTQWDIDQGLLMLDPHANLTSTDILNDSFTFLLRADHVQPAIGYLPFSIVPPDALLLQSFTPDVSLLVTEDNFVTSALSQEKPVVSSGPTAQTETLGKLTQIRWQKPDPWGRHSDGKASPTGVFWPQAATKDSPWAPTQPRKSSYPLMVIIPLAAVVFFLLVTVVALCAWLLGQKVEKRKTLIKLQTDLEPTTPSPRPERSITVPTVTVTPLLKSSSCPQVSLFRALPCEQMASPVTEPGEKCAPWETWVNLDPDMVKLCRQTNPTLKHNQYWV
ncbi:chondroitin sulfate proteoglycan 4 isoform X3 [Rousettus aegyptiacus]|uniref:Chondroitin sulfate proteoglycan 4 n=1 Tax=Rousettus aegyptiacus TaxID=9407 RepID=A0A7J8EXQ6_ROUAE|nr:chondroitin sulfate proteoglycan 4 isoform X3 [Rousettus aegyptiacus]KAF6440267.1 chondroitin sulfate proteoglycan 4 [Rousettus aegyptiacus]